MGKFTVGDVIIIAFPYADFSAFKKRPALIVGPSEFNKFITCQITSKAFTSKKAIRLGNRDFSEGGLKIDSYIRPDKIFTIEQSLVLDKRGQLSPTKINQVKASIREIFD